MSNLFRIHPQAGMNFNGLVIRQLRRRTHVALHVRRAVNSAALTITNVRDYAHPVTAKSVTGIGVPSLLWSHRPQQNVSGFFVRAVQHPVYGRLDGGLFGGAGPQGSRYANAVQSPTLIGVRVGGADLIPWSLAMADPTQVTPAINPTEFAIVDGQPTTTSLLVAQHFGKNHRDVLKRITTLDCSVDFSQRNFALCTRRGANNKPEPYYRMTRDGFTFLCMGFTGKEAAKWKEAYINAFNEMEQQLHEQQASRAPVHVTTDEDVIQLHYNQRPLLVYRNGKDFWYRAGHIAALVGVRDGYALSRSLPPEDVLAIQEGNQKAAMLSHRAMLASLGRLKREDAEALLAWLQMVIPGAFTPAEPQLPATAPRTARVLVAFGPNGDVQSKPVADDACVIRPQDLADWLGDPHHGPALTLLPTIIGACAKRLDSAFCVRHVKEPRS